jgi:hypothetical protein
VKHFTDQVEYHEPGARIYFNTADTYPGSWLYAHAPISSSRWWETTVSSTRNGNTRDGNYPRTAKEGGEGCIRAMSEDERDGIEICRQKNNGGDYYQESVDLYIRRWVASALVSDQIYVAPRYAPCHRSGDPNSDDVYTDVCIGSMIALAVQNDGVTAHATVYSAGKLLAGNVVPWAPDWGMMGSFDFAQPLTKQGFRGWKSQLFAGTRSAEAFTVVGVNDWRPLGLHDVSTADVPLRSDTDPSSKVIDLSY